VPYADFLRVLQGSTAHLHWTYPLVLSWNLLEAMSAGCAIVASDTAPVREAIRHGETGQSVDFRDVARVGHESVVECAHAMPDFMS
jgi:glycosyltransferase involved in cell wall biosynthesis